MSFLHPLFTPIIAADLEWPRHALLFRLTLPLRENSALMA